jgi:hypothetical protein
VCICTGENDVMSCRPDEVCLGFIVYGCFGFGGGGFPFP